MSERDPLPPAMGERRAIGGYHPQYRVAAGLIIRALRNGALEWIRVADPEAGRVDDLQIGWRRLRLAESNRRVGLQYVYRPRERHQPLSVRTFTPVT